VLQEQFPKFRQGNHRQWHDGPIGFISCLLREAAGADIQASISRPPATKKRSQFVGAHRAASVLHFDEDARLLQAESVGRREDVDTSIRAIQESGDGLQSVYLAEVPSPLADALIGLIGQAYWDAYSTIAALQAPHEPTEAEEVATIDATMAGPTFREQIVRARRGQGVFRANVLLREDACRVTHVSEPRHLKASHIKPWRDATDAERLDGSNGLLLSPHIDHLFDEGYITFSPSQDLVIVPEVRDKLLDAWGIDAGARVGEFSKEQNAYLDYHRTNVFKRSLLDP
jgi:hypothetical protein